MNVPRILALVRKREDGESFDLGDVVAKLSEFCGCSVSVVDSANWYQREFARHGNWESFAWETVLGKSFETREPYFTGFALTIEVLGRGNALIVNLALRNKKAVFLCVEGQELRQVTSVIVNNADDWQAGWSVASSEC